MCKSEKFCFSVLSMLLSTRKTFSEKLIHGSCGFGSYTSRLLLLTLIIRIKRNYCYGQYGNGVTVKQLPSTSLQIINDKQANSTDLFPDFRDIMSITKFVLSVQFFSRVLKGFPLCKAIMFGEMNTIMCWCH